MKNATRARKPLDISRDVERYLGITQVCIDVAIGGLEARLGSRRAAVRAWLKSEAEASKRRNERSLVRLGRGGGR